MPAVFRTRRTDGLLSPEFTLRSPSVVTGKDLRDQAIPTSARSSLLSRAPVSLAVR